MEARRAERLKTVELLKTSRTPLQLVEVATQAERIAEEAVRTAMAQVPPRAPAACREGCAWCCHKTVGTAVPEVVRIVAYLRQTLSPEEFQATQERIVALDAQRAALRPDRRRQLVAPCSLLVNNRCLAYPVRPLTCRGYTSTDARQCELSLDRRNQVSVPLYLPQQRLAAFVLDGMRSGLGEARLRGELLELTAALRIALTVPDTVQRWLAGEPVFAAAVLP